MHETETSYRRYCSGKKSFATREIARAAAEGKVMADGARPGKVLRPYRCPACLAWHIGHAPAELAAPGTLGQKLLEALGVERPV